MDKKSLELVGKEKENLQWSTSMDAWFIEAMLYEQNKGNQPYGTFTTAAYNNMVKFLREKLELPGLKKEHLKNRLKTLKQKFTECYELFQNNSSSGFFWSPMTKLWTAEPEIWKTLLETKPAAAKWKTKPFHNYDNLEKLFAKGGAVGKGVDNAKGKKRRLEKNNENEVTIDELENLVFQNCLSSENFIGLGEFEDTTLVPKAQSHSGATSNLKKMRISSGTYDEECMSVLTIEKIANMMSESNKEIINAFANATATMSALISSSQQRIYSPSEIYAELSRMKLEQPLLDEAYYWLADNEKMAKLLIGFPQERRKDVLRNLMVHHKAINGQLF